MAAILVTGGAGFIGSHLAAALVARGNVVRVVDNLVTGTLDNVPAGVEFVVGDLVDPAVVAAAVDGCEVVLHQAAIPSVPRSIAEPRPSHDANINATFNVLVAARDAGVRRVVYAASSSVYGDTDVLPKVEIMPANPRSPYALQKQVGEAYCRLFAQLHGLETVSIRYFNVFGPRQRPSSPYSGVLSLFIKAALERTAPTIHGDGLQTRDFTYIDNVVDGVLRAIDAPAAAGEAINVACGGRVSLLDAWGRSAPSSARSRRRCSWRRGRGTFATRRPTSAKPNVSSAIGRACRSSTASGRRLIGLGEWRKSREHIFGCP